VLGVYVAYKIGAGWYDTFVEKILKALEDLGIPKIGMLIVLFVASLLGLWLALPELGSAVFFWMGTLAPLWLPVLLLIVLWRSWIWYIRAYTLAKQEISTLEVMVPREIQKSPRAMEAFFDGISIGIGETTFIDTLIKGKTRPWFSCEIVSNGGRIHFYIRTLAFLKDIVEAQLYAAYPGIEIYEVEDYSALFSYNPEKHEVRGADFVLAQKDAYPIKTYIDYELEKDPKEELKIDPISHLFEILSILKPGEQLWIQILIRTNKDKVRERDPKTKKTKWFKKTDRWKQEAKEEIEKITEASRSEFTDVQGKKQKGLPTLTHGQTERIKAIERSIGKNGFDTGIRGVYIANKDVFNANRFVGMLGVFKQFSSAHLNGLKPAHWHLSFSYPWQDFRGILQQRTSYRVIDAYKRRSWFHPPYKTQHYVMTSEELATIYHFPSRTITAPGLERIPATKAEAPPNLPV